MDDGENQDVLARWLEDYAIVSNPQLPVTLQGSSQRLAVECRVRGQTYFDGSSDDLFVLLVDPGQIHSLDVRVIDQPLRHLVVSPKGVA